MTKLPDTLQELVEYYNNHNIELEKYRCGHRDPLEIRRTKAGKMVAFNPLQPNVVFSLEVIRMLCKDKAKDVRTAKAQHNKDIRFEKIDAKIKMVLSEKDYKFYVEYLSPEGW